MIIFSLLFKKHQKVDHSIFSKEYVCKKCGFSSEVTVMSYGIGQGVSFLFIADEEAIAKARQRAFRNAVKNSELIVKLCPCPKCAARDSRGYILKNLCYGLGVMTFNVGFYWFLKRLGVRLGPDIYRIFLAIGFLSPFLIYFTAIHPTWSTAKSRVLFPKPEASKMDRFRSHPRS